MQQHPGANVSKIYLVFQLLDLGLSDCVFDLELLGAEMGEKKKRGEEKRGWSDHQMHGCTSSPSTVDTERWMETADPVARPQRWERREIK